MQTLITKPQAAQALGISIRQLELYIRSGQIKVRKLGPRCVRIEPSEIDRFIERIGEPALAAEAS